MTYNWLQKLSPTVVACGSGYVGDRGDRISHRIIDKCVVRIGENAACNISAATCVDQAADGRGRYIAERKWQDSTLLHPAGRVRRKLPNLVASEAVEDIVATQNVDLVVEDGDATGQGARVPGGQSVATVVITSATGS